MTSLANLNPVNTVNAGSSIIYSDVRSVQAIGQLAKNDKTQALSEVSKQFESILLQSMLRSMRSANKVFSEGSYFNSERVEFYQDMFDDQLSLEMTRGNGIGLAETIERQLQSRYNSKSDGVGDTVPGATTELDAVALIEQRRLPALPVQQAIAVSREALQTLQAVGATMTNPVNSPPFTHHSFGGSPREFVQALSAPAIAAAQQLGVDPEVLLAQSGLETGWGRYVPRDANGANSFNLFGIKADSRWQGDSVQVQTLEYRDGQPVKVNAAFRRYQSYAESFADYVEFISTQPRYQQALQSAGDGVEYLQQLQRAGYATDPAYAEKIQRIIDRGDFSPVSNG